MNRIETFRKSVESGFKKDRISLKSIVALVLFACIILVFVFFGLPSRLNGSAGRVGAAAQVNNALISVAELRSESQRLEQMYAPLFGGGGMGDAQRQFVNQQALESLIAQEIAAQTAKKEGILATDSEIQDVIVREIPVFQKEGRFQRDLYFQLLEANHLTPAEFEQRLRKEKQTARARRLFEVAAQPLQMEVSKIKTLSEMKINVAFARVDKDRVQKSMKVAESEIKSKLANGEFAKKVEDFYNANKMEFNIEEQIHAQHILIKGSDDKAKNEMSEIQKRAKTEDFGKLAAQVSQDTGSKAKNGDLGFFGRGKMVPEFEAAAFSQKVGVIGEPVKTAFGFHLIKVLERKEARQKPLEEVRSEIAQRLIVTDLYDAQIKNLEDALAKSDGAAVESELKKMGASWDETGFFDMVADQVPKLQSVEASKAAFEVSEAKPLYPKLVRDGGEKFVLKLKAAKKEVSTENDRASKALQRERSTDLYGSWIENAKKTARIERNLELIKER